MADERRTVWILGAGFSRSLGGPLLGDLLSPPTNNFVQAIYRSNHFIGNDDMAHVDQACRNWREAANVVRSVYEQCGGATAHPTTTFWSDAEAFLDQLDAAAHGFVQARKRGEADSPATSRLARVLEITGFKGPSWDELRDAARRLVAAGCCAFLKDADLSEERWQPYVAWSEQTKPCDTVITFNYDRVLETLGNEFQIVDPSKDILPSRTHPQVFKLHGSVDWVRLEGPGRARYAITDEPEHALTCAGCNIGIATPGPTKRIAAEELETLWTAACQRIREASVVVFIGFRFPPSDAEARERLLEAIGSNGSPHLEIHLVLGPERTHRDVVRLEQLLRYALNRRGRSEITQSRLGMELFGRAQTFGLETHALFAEDFFTVWSRDLLWPKGLKIMS